VDAIVLRKGLTVTYWHERSEHNQATLQAMLDEFNRTNKYGITARAQIAGASYADLYKQVESAIKAGAPPELSAAFQSQAALYRAAGAIVDLGPLAQSKQYGWSQSDLDDFPPAVLAGDINPQFPGERLGWPVQRAMDVLYYNADWLRQLGYAAPPQDWKQFEEMACKAVDRGKGKTGWAVRHDATNFATLVLTRGGRILATDGQSYTFNSSSGVDAVQMIQRMMAQGCAVEVPTSERFGEEARFANGQVLFVLASSISLPYYADSVGKAAKFKWSIAPPPAGGKPLVVLSGASLSIHTTTPEKELAAWLVIKFLSERAQTARWAEETGYLPIRASAQAGVLAGLRTNRFYSPVADLYARLFEWLPFATSEPSVAGYDTVRYSMDRDVVSRALADPKADAKALLDAAVKKANDTLK
jgi:multiple sugar transport system substrate-binding protein/sn-glycerol 3-phosphate transport system substrate-binding protein